jgi:hypothetical protein
VHIISLRSDSPESGGLRRAFTCVEIGHPEARGRRFVHRIARGLGRDQQISRRGSAVPALELAELEAKATLSWSSHTKLEQGAAIELEGFNDDALGGLCRVVDAVLGQVYELRREICK